MGWLKIRDLLDWVRTCVRGEILPETIVVTDLENRSVNRDRVAVDYFYKEKFFT